MIYEDSKESLLKQGLIKKCPLDWKSINNLIKRVYTDLRTAREFIDIIGNLIKEKNPQAEFDF